MFYVNLICPNLANVLQLKLQMTSLEMKSKCLLDDISKNYDMLAATGFFLKWEKWIKNALEPG